MELIYWPVRSSSWVGGNGVDGAEGGIIFLASCEHPFIRVHKNLVQHTSNNISIDSIDVGFKIHACNLSIQT